MAPLSACHRFFSRCFSPQGHTGSLRLLQPLILFVAVDSIAILILSIFHGISLANNPYRDYKHASTATLIFYEGTIPVIPILVALYILAMNIFYSIDLVLCAGLSIATTVSFAAHLGVWTDCEIRLESPRGYCPQYGLDGWQIISGGIAGSCGWLGFMLAVPAVFGWACYSGIALYGALTKRKRSAEHTILP